ncbi:protein FAM189B [Tachyglossus aculeatus]|uniref:protein FAM189B n=1 Tax=Tachyglossus aculeatus TaxID=9261 RepID=UPI0018F7B9FE|nr:protein FAM189B [Tachyglossus aculeatus]
MRRAGRRAAGPSAAPGSGARPGPDAPTPGPRAPVVPGQHAVPQRVGGGLTRLGPGRPWGRALLGLGVAQLVLGVLVAAGSLLAASFTASNKMQRSCPSWAGFSLTLSGLVGIVCWKRPLTLVISFFSLLSVLCVVVSLAGAVLTCRNAQLARDFHDCQLLKGVCVCCPPPPLPRDCLPGGQALSLYPNPNCPGAPMAFKDLLFSVCGLTACATVLCSVSAVLCCVRIFSLDLAHTLAPQRTASTPPGWVSPPAPLLHTVLDLEEFVPPVPPPPYYPPEYTCSSETDAQSITYNGSMDSPVPLYPTDCPPSYEAVMGLCGSSQATLFDPHLHTSCTCERAASIVDVSMDSGSLALSGIGDIPGDSSPSEDSCLLELQGSMRSVDYVLFRSIQRSRAGYCLSLDCGRPCGLRGPFEDRPGPPDPPRAARSFSCSAPGPPSPPPPPAGRPPAPAHSCHRLEAWPGPCFPELRRRGPRGPGAGGGPGPRGAPRRFSDSSGSLTPPARSPRAPHTPVDDADADADASAPPAAPLPRARSDPGIARPHPQADFRDCYTKVLDEESASVSSADTGLCSDACLFRLGRCPSPRLLRARSAEKRRPPPPPPLPAWHKGAPAPPDAPAPAGPAPAHSLGDLKGGRPGRGLVARFLHVSRRRLEPDAPKQVPPSPWARPSHEELHLRSCGDLSSGSSLRRLLSARRLDRSNRPRSLNGGSRESGL